ncbi:MAG: folate-binding protein [Pseudonocardiaceae bacterium]|nr:folate-binding protein [Pseudonocardiaceae bacterium]
MSSPLLETPGAIPAPEGHPDAGVPWHFGDPFAEQRTAARSVVVVDRSDREVLAVPGADRLDWLHNLTTQHFNALREPDGSEALVLDLHGRIEHHTIVANVADTVWLDTEKGRSAALLGYLDSMRFWSKVDPRDASGELAVLSVLGPDADAVLDKLGVALDARPYAVAALPAGGFARRMPWPHPNTVDLLVPREELTGWWQRITDAGARPAGSWAYEALRVEALRPRLGVDTDEKAIPNEVNWLGSAVHLDKGCYRGQETVAKVYNVGKPPRRMALLHLDGSPEVLPETGESLRHGERVVGRVGSVEQHHELGPIALALVKRSVQPDAELLAGEDDHVVQAAIDPDSLPAEHVAPGREAAKGLRG